MRDINKKLKGFCEVQEMTCILGKKQRRTIRWGGERRIQNLKFIIIIFQIMLQLIIN